LKWVSADESIEKKGVTYHDPENCFEGINIYSSSISAKAYLVATTGEILHSWALKNEIGDPWHYVEMISNGDLLVIIQDKFLMKLDWDSNIKWIKEIRGHHDIALDKNGNTFVLDRRDAVVFVHGIPLPILNDYIVLFSSTGDLKKEINLSRTLSKEISIKKLISIYKKIFLHIIKPTYILSLFKRKTSYLFVFMTPFDIFHTNTIEIINRDLLDLRTNGDLLISVRELDLIGILNIKRKEFVWKWGPGKISKQHHPNLLENGNILIFDNGVQRKYSRIIELNPFTKNIVWEYISNPPNSFYSEIRGGNQRLPNGNILITESEKGRVFEVTNEGQIVWEFYTPDINEKKKERAAIYRMMRIIKPENYPILKYYNFR
jgi:hypothetical protein